MKMLPRIVNGTESKPKKLHNAQILHTLLTDIKKFDETGQRKNATVAFKFSIMNISSLANC